MIYTPLVKKAALISFEAHKEQFDKGGYPYFIHPLIMANSFDDEDCCCVALLHDVIEDHGDKYDLNFFKEKGFNQKIIDAIELLTHDANVPYMEYIDKIKDNPIARKVKLADLKHNTTLSRNHDSSLPTKLDLYYRSIEILESYE